MVLLIISIVVLLVVGAGQVYLLLSVYRMINRKIEQGQAVPLRRVLLILAGFAVLSSILCAYAIGYSWALVLSLYCSTAAVFIASLVFAFRFFTNPVHEHAIRRMGKLNVPLALLLALLLPASILSPFWGSSIIRDQCDAYHRAQGSALYPALVKYRADYGDTPDPVNRLVPDYAPEISKAACFRPVRWLGLDPQFYEYLRDEQDFVTVKCRDGLGVLVVEDMDHNQPWVLNLDTGQWHEPWGDTLDDWVGKRICDGAVR